MSVVAFAMALIGSSAVAAIAGNHGMRRSAIVLCLVWLACMIAVQVTGSLSPWWAFVVIDAAAGWVVTRQPSSRPQAIIGACFLFQVMFHLIFAVHLASLGEGTEPAVGVYLNLLSMVGWLQIATLFGGSIYDGGNRNRGPFVRWHLSDAGAAYHRRLGKLP